MLSLIETPGGAVIQRGRLVNPQLQVSLTKHNANIDQLVQWYRENLVTVPTEHPLARLLFTMGYSHIPTPIAVHNKAKEDLQFIADSISMFTSEKVGAIYEDGFYGSNTALVNSRFYSSVDLFDRDWVDLEPVRVMYREGWQGIYKRPDLVELAPVDTFCLIGVDVAALAWQYKHWQLQNATRDPEHREYPVNFLARYVFPAMLRSNSVATILNVLELDGTERYVDTGDNKPVVVVTQHLNDIREQSLALIKPLKGGTPSQLLSILPVGPGIVARDGIARMTDLKTYANGWCHYMAGLVATRIAVAHTPKNPKLGELKARAKQVERDIRSNRLFHRIEQREYREFATSHALGLLDTIGK